MQGDFILTSLYRKKHESNKLLISLVGLVMAAVPFTNAYADAHGETINIYGWQNWSYEFVDNGTRDFDRLSNNAANIGFMAHMDTGIEGLQVGFRCEQFTYWGRFNQYTNWCNRNSKISLRSETMGEIMAGQWLLPYNEIVAQWVDPFYDAGADSHTSIMGNIGGTADRAGGWLSSLFYNGSFENSADFTTQFGTLAFNRRQEGIVQYVWPNTSAMASQTRDGFQFRFAITSGDGIETVGVDTRRTVTGREIDPRIMSTGVAYQHNMGNSQIWVAAAYEQHEDVSAANLGAGTGDNDTYCDDSDDEGYRLAGRYKHDWGNGQSTWIAAMYEELEYDASCGMVTMRDADGDPTAIGDLDNTNAPIWSGVERDAFMISGKHAFGNGIDFRFSYMDADEWDCDADVCTAADERDTDADAINVGLFYTMPAGTELRATYSEVSNENNAGYDFGINGANPGVTGEDIEMFAVGIVHYFD